MKSTIAALAIISWPLVLVVIAIVGTLLFVCIIALLAIRFSRMEYDEVEQTELSSRNEPYPPPHGLRLVKK